TFVDDLRPGEIEAILLHEWDHIRRGDLWLLAACRWLMVLFFAHPLFWWMRRKVHLDQELLADAAASKRTGPIDYAAALIRGRRPLPFAGGPAGAGRGQVLPRARPPPGGTVASEPRCPAALRAGAIALAVAAGLALSLWTLHPGARAATAAAPAGEGAPAAE